MCVQRPGRAHRDGVPGAGRRLVALGRGLRPLNRPQLLRRRSHGDLRNAPGSVRATDFLRRLRCFHPHNQYLANGEVNTQNGELAHTLERAIEREDLAKQGSETIFRRGHRGTG